MDAGRERRKGYTNPIHAPLDIPAYFIVSLLPPSQHSISSSLVVGGGRIPSSTAYSMAYDRLVCERCA